MPSVRKQDGSSGKGLRSALVAARLPRSRPTPGERPEPGCARAGSAPSRWRSCSGRAALPLRGRGPPCLSLRSRWLSSCVNSVGRETPHPPGGHEPAGPEDPDGYARGRRDSAPCGPPEPRERDAARGPRPRGLHPEGPERAQAPPPAPGRPLLRGAGGVVARGPEPVAPPPPLPPARARTSLRRHRGVQYRSRRCPR